MSNHTYEWMSRQEQIKAPDNARLCTLFGAVAELNELWQEVQKLRSVAVWQAKHIMEQHAEIKQLRHENELLKDAVRGESK